MNEREQEIRSVFESLQSGTDKFQHGYAPVYATLPKDITSILEIGVDKGYSLLAWSRLFPQANIVGLDTDPKVFMKEVLGDPRIFIHKGDVRTFDTDLTFDVIIDDCLHDLDTISVSWYRFRNKFRVAYIIEDVVPSIIAQIYELVTSNFPKAQVLIWRTSEYKGDVTFKDSDSNCVIVRHL